MVVLYRSGRQHAKAQAGWYELSEGYGEASRTPPGWPTFEDAWAEDARAAAV
jgi:hypothetical protein